MIFATLRRLAEIRRGPVCIVETGTIRSDSYIGRVGDGWSTVAWGWYCLETRGQVFTIDVDAGALEICRHVTAPYSAVIEYVRSDSVHFLRQWTKARRGKIDLLYLDSLDYFDHEASEAHCLAEVETAIPSLANSCLLLLDDTQPIMDACREGVHLFTGKGARAVPDLLQRGFELEWCAGGQVLLSRLSGH